MSGKKRLPFLWFLTGLTAAPVAVGAADAPIATDALLVEDLSAYSLEERPLTFDEAITELGLKDSKAGTLYVLADSGKLEIPFRVSPSCSNDLRIRTNEANGIFSFQIVVQPGGSLSCLTERDCSKDTSCKPLTDVANIEGDLRIKKTATIKYDNGKDLQFNPDGNDNLVDVPNGRTKESSTRFVSKSDQDVIDRKEQVANNDSWLENLEDAAKDSACAQRVLNQEAEIRRKLPLKRTEIDRIMELAMDTVLQSELKEFEQRFEEAFRKRDPENNDAFLAKLERIMKDLLDKVEDLDNPDASEAAASLISGVATKLVDDSGGSIWSSSTDIPAENYIFAGNMLEEGADELDVESTTKNQLRTQSKRIGLDFMEIAASRGTLRNPRLERSYSRMSTGFQREAEREMLRACSTKPDSKRCADAEEVMDRVATITETNITSNTSYCNEVGQDYNNRVNDKNTRYIPMSIQSAMMKCSAGPAALSGQTSTTFGFNPYAAPQLFNGYTMGPQFSPAMAWQGPQLMMPQQQAMMVPQQQMMFPQPQMQMQMQGMQPQMGFNPMMMNNVF